MSPIGTVGFVLSIVAGLMVIVGAVRMVKRTDVTLAVIFFATTLMIGVGSLVRAADLPVGSGWFVVTITAGVFWISAAAFYGFWFRRSLASRT
ncbi:MAG: hypothetical protein ACTHQM_12745 [Thermoanaerobaculia bacterium]